MAQLLIGSPDDIMAVLKAQHEAYMAALSGDTWDGENITAIGARGWQLSDSPHTVVHRESGWMVHRWEVVAALRGES